MLCLDTYAFLICAFEIDVFKYFFYISPIPFIPVLCTINEYTTGDRQCIDIRLLLI